MQTKLLINLNLLRPPLTGIGFYTKNIIKECFRRDIELIGIKNGEFYDKQEIEELINSLESYSNTSRRSSYSFKNKLFRLVRLFPGVYNIKYTLVCLRARKRLNALAKLGYVYFEPSFVPLKYNGKIITTVHDLSFIKHPEYHPVERVKFLTKMMKKMVSISNHIIVDSNFIKKELLDHYSLPEEQVSTVYLGVENKFKVYEKQETCSTLDKLKINHDKYILSVATLEPRKNLTRLVEAYRSLSEELKNKYPLVLVGDSGWKNSSFFASIQDLIESGNVVVTGYLSDRQLNHVYSSAALFVYPSLYEGFGLPIIEAMASGTAVITSDCGATAEVAGDAALLVNPECTKAITEGISTVLSDDKLRILLSEKATNRAAAFTWQKCVDDILSIAVKLQ